MFLCVCVWGGGGGGSEIMLEKRPIAKSKYRARKKAKKRERKICINKKCVTRYHKRERERENE